MTHQYPENIQGLVLISTHPYTDSPQRRQRRQKEIDFIRKGKKEATHPATPNAIFQSSAKRTG